MTKLSLMYWHWLMIIRGNYYDPLGNVLWIEREYGFTFEQSKKIHRIFRNWLFNNYVPSGLTNKGE
jgi:hypothetical protein